MGTTPLVLPQGFSLSDLTDGLVTAGSQRDTATLGTNTAEALNRLDSGLQDLYAGLNDIFAAGPRLPILIQDPLGNVVGSLGYKLFNNTAVYGLAVADQRGHLEAFVGIQTEVPLPITATSNANPDVITVPGHTFLNGDTVLNFGSIGDTNINIIGIVRNSNQGAGTFTMIDLSLAPVAGNGAYGGGGFCQRFNGGGYFQQIAIGGNGTFAGAIIRAFADGSVVINGAQIMLNANGVTTTIGNLNIGGTFGVAGLDVKNNAVNSRDILVTDTGFLIRASDQATPVVNIQAPADIGHVVLDKLSTTFRAQLDAQLGLFLRDNAGTPNVSRMNGTQLFFTTPTGQVVFVDSTVPSITFGIAGAAQSVMSDLQFYAQDAGNTKNVTLTPAAGLVVISASANSQLSDSLVLVQNAAATTHAQLASTGAVSGTDATGTWALNGATLSFGGVQVVGHRKTGWVLPTGTLSRATFDQSTVTLAGLAQVVAALVTDLFNQHKLIGT